MYSSVKFFDPTMTVGPAFGAAPAVADSMSALVSDAGSPTITTERHFFRLISFLPLDDRRLHDDGWFLLAQPYRSSMAEPARGEQAFCNEKEEICCKREQRDDDRGADDAREEIRRLVEDDVAERAAADDARERRRRHDIDGARAD